MVKRYYTKKELRNMGFSDSDYGQVYETVPPYTKEEKLDMDDSFSQSGGCEKDYYTYHPWLKEKSITHDKSKPFWKIW